MYIQTETGALINLSAIHNIDHQKEKDGRGGYTGEYEVIAETDQKVYVIQTVSTLRDTLDVVEMIKQRVIASGQIVIELPEDASF